MAKRVKAERWTTEHAQRVVGAWERSGKSGAAFARSIGVVAQRLFWWRRRLEKLGVRGSARAALVPVVVRGTPVSVGSPPSPPVVVTMAWGARIEVHDIEAATAAWVVAVLGGGERS